MIGYQFTRRPINEIPDIHKIGRTMLVLLKEKAHKEGIKA